MVGKCEHIRIKLQIYSHLLNKLLTENFILCVMNIVGFTSCKFFFKPNCQFHILYFDHHLTQISIQASLRKSIFGTGSQ